MINKLGFGFLRLPKRGEEYDWETVNSMVDAFMDGGGTFFDTCYTYLDGNSELGIRKCVVQRKERNSFQLCEKHCPQNLGITKHMKTIAEYFE